MIFGSPKGMFLYRPRLTAADVTIAQESDRELGGWAPFERIDDVVRLIGPSRLRAAPSAATQQAATATQFQKGRRPESQPASGSTRRIRAVP